MGLDEELGGRFINGGDRVERRLGIRQRREEQTPPAETQAINMETVVQTASATASLDRDSLPRRALRVTPRGASSHFVGSSIMILSSFAVSTLAMNCGKKIQESKRANLM